MKQKVLCLVCILMLVFCTGVFAAPASVGTGDYGTAGYITITNPEKTYSTTYNKTVTISGYAASGATVYVYVFDGASYKPYYHNGAMLTAAVGASGMFAIPVNLNSGRNLFLLRAESGGNYQNTTFEVNLLSSSMFTLIDRLKSLTFKLK